MKIVILDGYTENPGDLSWDGFEKLGELKVYDRTDVNDNREIIKSIGDADIVYTNKTPLNREILEYCKSIKFIGVLATGYNVVDIETAKKLKIPVSNIPTYGTTAVAQFTTALLLEICHHIGHHNNEVKAGRWTENKDWCFWDYPLIELSGKTAGIIGFGRIGEATGKVLKSFGMRIITSTEDFRESQKEIAELVSLDELFRQSDVISLHCPLLPNTEGIINKNNISKMKDGVIILNASRGGLVIDNDLAEGLNSGKIYAAGLDVVSVEPIEKNNPLLKAKNCFITPHIAWASKESRSRLMNIAVENLKSFIDGKPQNVVNL